MSNFVYSTISMFSVLNSYESTFSYSDEVFFLSQKIKDDLIPHDKTYLGEAVEILKKCNL